MRDPNWLVRSILGLSTVLFASTVSAAVIPVGPGESIQTAIAAARNDDEIAVAPGTYTEAIDLLGKAITVRSTGGNSVTIIDGSGADDAVVTIFGPVDGTTVLDGFTILGGAGAEINAPGGGFMRVGGGISVDGGGPTILNCTVRASAADAGGGMWCRGGIPIIANCNFVGNASAEGGGLYCDDAAATVSNCAFTLNTSTSGAAVAAVEGVGPTLTNCIVWGNEPEQVTPLAVVQFSNVEGGYEGSNNIDSDPLFADPAAGDLHLLLGSPCANSGANWAPGLPDADIDGGARILFCRVDIGPDETPEFLDCNQSGFPDDCEIYSGASPDENANGVPDECDSDLDGDGDVDFGDLLTLLSNWGPCDSCPADYDGDGFVNFVDLSALLTHWG